MRRGKISNINFIIIIMVAIFTLISYLADQLVIRNEDSLRNLNIEYNNTKTELRTNESISHSITSIQMRSSTIIDDYLYKRNIWIKSLLLIVVDKNYQNFFTNRELNYKQDLKYNLVDDFLSITVDTNSIREEFQDIILWLDDTHYKKITGPPIAPKPIGIKEYNPFDLFHNTEDFGLNNYEFFNKDRSSYIDLLVKKGAARKTLMDSFSIKNWFDIYKFTILRTEGLYQDMNRLDIYTEYFDNYNNNLVVAEAADISSISREKPLVSGDNIMFAKIYTILRESSPLFWGFLRIFL